jgi:hypothetical protein
MPLPKRDQSRPATSQETAQAQVQLRIAYALLQKAPQSETIIGELRNAANALNIARQLDSRATVKMDDVTLTIDALSATALYIEAHFYAHDFEYKEESVERMMQNKHQRQALAAIDKALGYDASRARFWAVKARLHSNLNQRKEGLAAARRAVELDQTDSDALQILGQLQ